MAFFIGEMSAAEPSFLNSTSNMSAFGALWNFMLSSKLAPMLNTLFFCLSYRLTCFLEFSRATLSMFSDRSENTTCP